MPTFNMYHEFGNNLSNGLIDLDTHVFKWALVSDAPVQATDSLLADVTQVATANGYPAGGQALDSVAWAETAGGSGIWRFTAADEVFTASGGSIGPFQYVVLYCDTAAGDPLVGYLNYGSAITVTDGNTFTVDVGASGIFTLTVPAAV